MVSKNLCVVVLWMKVSSALEGLIIIIIIGIYIAPFPFIKCSKALQRVKWVTGYGAMCNGVIDRWCFAKRKQAFIYMLLGIATGKRHTFLALQG